MRRAESEPRPTPPQPQFDWRDQQSGQKRDLARFGAEFLRVLSLRGGSPTVRQAVDRLRERWEQLVRRLDGRWAGGGDAWERQAETITRLRSERDVLRALVEYDEECETGDLDRLFAATLRVISRCIPGDGALIHLADIGGQPHRSSTQRGHGRMWPLAADRELAERIADGAREGRRITIEGRPVKSGPRDHNRLAHWLAVGIAHGADAYGSLVLGRTAAEEAFGEEHVEILERIARHFAVALAARVGTGVQPEFGSGPRPEGFEHLWGEAAAFRQALHLAARFAASETPVLLEGELGTGRESLAKAMHARSPRAGGPFVVFRGSDLPEDIVVRGLFGAVTVGTDGRVTEEPGDIELARGGTLYVDDLRALGPVLQVRLLRLLNEGMYERVGDRTPRPADVRLMIVAASSPEDAVARGQLREDLYYQITTARLALPPLRARGGDVLELARRFAIAAGQKIEKRIDGIDSAAARLLSTAHFPGNVQQLAQVVERAVFMASRPLVSAADLPREMTARVVAAPAETGTWIEQAARAVHQAGDAGSTGDWQQFRRARKQVLSSLESAFANAVVKTVGKHPSRAARHLGIHRAQWWRLWRDVQVGRGEAAPVEEETPDERQEQTHNGNA